MKIPFERESRLRQILDRQTDPNGKFHRSTVTALNDLLETEESDPSIEGWIIGRHEEELTLFRPSYKFSLGRKVRQFPEFDPTVRIGLLLIGDSPSDLVSALHFKLHNNTGRDIRRGVVTQAINSFLGQEHLVMSNDLVVTSRQGKHDQIFDVFVPIENDSQFMNIKLGKKLEAVGTGHQVETRSRLQVRPVTQKRILPFDINPPVNDTSESNPRNLTIDEVFDRAQVLIDMAENVSDEDMDKASQALDKYKSVLTEEEASEHKLRGWGGRLIKLCGLSQPSDPQQKALQAIANASLYKIDFSYLDTSGSPQVQKFTPKEIIDLEQHLADESEKDS